MSEAAKHIDDLTLKKLIALVKTLTGITMEERKRPLLFGRLRPRVRFLGLKSIEEYLELLTPGSDEIQQFINLVTTNETLFFRTPLVWEHFQADLPLWYKDNIGQTLKVWSAASSSGEEAHSIAMICEDFKTLNPEFKYRVYGSDISTEVLELARAGVYEGKNVDEFRAKHPAYFHKYFKKTPEKKYKSMEIITKNMEFSQHNLFSRPAMIGFYDVVFLRNVLIYFNQHDQELVLSNIHGSLKKNGILILGESESLSRLKTSFVFVKPLIYRKA